MIEALGNASEQERRFFHDFAQKWQGRQYDLMETAFVLGCEHFGYDYITDVANNPEDLAEKMRLAYRGLYGREDGWFSAFVYDILRFNDTEKGKIEPANVIFFLQDAIAQTQAETEAARDLLRDSPETFKKEIMEAVHKNPALLGQ